MKTYQELNVWQAAMELSVRCYNATREFPRDELFGLTSQIRRASVSVPANIAEGWGRQSTKDYIRFLRIAHGSLKEIETHLILSYRVGLLPKNELAEFERQADAIGKMLSALIRSLQNKKP